MMWVIDSIHFINSIERQKAMLREMRAALNTAQAAQGTPQPATATLIPKPRGTSGHGKFNLANEMGVDKKLCGQIQVCLSFSPLPVCSQHPQAPVRSLVNMSTPDKNVTWKNQPRDEVHKIFTVMRHPLIPIIYNGFTYINLDHRAVSNYEEFRIQLGHG